jgi:hypothetical protein
MSTQLTGAAGEYYVAAELSRRAWACSITPKGVARTDVLAQHVESGYVIAVQVKSTATGTTFTLGEKNEAPSPTTNEWYALVGFDASSSAPRYFFLPRNHVAALIYVDHRVWLKKPARDGSPHNDNPRRTIYAKNLPGGLDDFDRLHTPTDAVPLELSPYYAALIEEAPKLGVDLPAFLTDLLAV